MSVGGAADLGAAGGIRAPQFSRPAQCGRLAADGAAHNPRSVPGLGAVSDHLRAAERAQTRLLPELRQGTRRNKEKHILHDTVKIKIISSFTHSHVDPNLF